MIDPAIRAFVADSEGFYPPNAASLPIADQRRLYDRYAEAFALARPGGVTSDDAPLTLPDRTVRLRRYRPPGIARGAILFAHGGGFMLGSLDSHDGVAARIAAGTGADVVAIDYRLAPEHPAPAALHDVTAVTEAVLDGTSPWPDLAAAPVVLIGDSAGGTLVAGAALRLGRGRRAPLAGLALIYPALGFEPAEPARSDEADAPMLTLADVYFYRDLVLAGAPPEPDSLVLDAEDIGPLPPTGLLPAEHDPLRDDCTVLAHRLAALDKVHRLIPGTGLVHGFLRALDRSPAAATAFDALMGFVVSCLDRSREKTRSA